MTSSGDVPAEWRALPAVAREAIAARLEGREAKLPTPRGELMLRAPVFVTLRIDGELRGCIGELDAQFSNLVEETADRAVAAASRDDRFPPLRRDELDRVSIEVTVLGELESIQSTDQLDPARYGVVVGDEQGRRGVLLPGIAGVDSVEQQIGIACRKAHIDRSRPYRLERFGAREIHEG